MIEGIIEGILEGLWEVLTDRASDIIQDRNANPYIRYPLIAAFVIMFCITFVVLTVLGIAEFRKRGFLKKIGGLILIIIAGFAISGIVMIFVNI